MLTKCMVSPLKLARLMEWNGRLGKSCPIMAIDITNRHIGIALAYYRQQPTPSPSSLTHQGYENDSSKSYDDYAKKCHSFSITPLPPIPYMSNRPYHPSYAFLHHHSPEGAHVPRCLDRLERTFEVADQLAQLAINRQVRGIVIRWPGELASAVCGGDLTTIDSMREADEEGKLVFSSSSTTTTTTTSAKNPVNDGSAGYMRGRILYLLDKCCTRHGHAHTNVHMEPLLMEGSRPFALFDTSVSEQDWIVRDQSTNSHSRQNDSHAIKSGDKYKYAFAEMDVWGRCPSFGNQPPPPHQGKFYYSSMETHSGYKVSSQFDLGNKERGNNESDSKRLPQRNPDFDGLMGNESMIQQFHESLSAMHTLCDFAKEYLQQGRIVLPVWASISYSSSSNAMTDVSQKDSSVRHESESKTDRLLDNGSTQSSTPHRQGTLAQLPIRKNTRRGRR